MDWMENLLPGGCKVPTEAGRESNIKIIERGVKNVQEKSFGSSNRSSSVSRRMCEKRRDVRAIDQDMADKINVCPWTCETKWEKCRSAVLLIGAIIGTLGVSIGIIGIISGEVRGWATYFMESKKLPISEWLAQREEATKRRDK